MCTINVARRPHSFAESVFFSSDHQVLSVDTDVEGSLVEDSWPRRILVPHDLTESSREAVRVARHFAEALHPEIVFCHALREERPFSPVLRETPGGAERLKAARRSLARWVDAELEGYDRTELIVGWGAPPDQIANAARTCGADIVVVTTCPTLGRTRTTHRNVAAEVLRSTESSVLSLRPSGARARAVTAPQDSELYYG